MRQKIDRGTSRYLTAPDSLMADLESKLIDWKRELAELEATIRFTEAAQCGDQQSAFSEWWEKVKGQLVAVKEIEWGKQQSIREPINLTAPDRRAIQKRIGAKVGKCRASWKGDPDSDFKMTLGQGNMVELTEKQDRIWVESEFPIRPAVLAEIDALRELLHQLNVKITLFWKPANGRNFTLDRRRLQAEIKSN
ncbi:MAG: hypothetical protein JNG90_01520, partial [Planctomycetaceae bacterium]|nr:hypothetical protein [Planctomycetaceae bacterium]